MWGERGGGEGALTPRSPQFYRPCYNSHHHYHYHHFHCHCTMYLYHLRILLSIPLDCYMIPCLFQLNFVFFLPVYIFSLVLLQAFRIFLAQEKDSEFVYDHQTNFRCSLYTSIYIYSYLQFLIYTYLLVLIYTYLLIYTYVFFILLYELDKIVKIWGI